MQSKIEITEILGPADWIVFSLVFLATIGSVIYGQWLKSRSVSSEKESFLDLLLMGRQLTLPMFLRRLAQCPIVVG